MSPSARPFSASSARSNTAAADGSIGTFFMDRSGFLGLEGGSKLDRPVSETVNLLIDAAHQRHENRNVRHPATHAYTLFAQRAAEVSAINTSSNSSKCRNPSSGGGGGVVPSLSLDTSRSLGSYTGHSSTAVYAWGEGPLSSRGSKGPQVPLRGANGGEGHVPITAATSAAAPAKAAATVVVGSTRTVAAGSGTTGPAGRTGRIHREPSPLGRRSPAGRTVRQTFSPMSGLKPVVATGECRKGNVTPTSTTVVISGKAPQTAKVKAAAAKPSASVTMTAVNGKSKLGSAAAATAAAAAPSSPRSLLAGATANAHSAMARTSAPLSLSPRRQPPIGSNGQEGSGSPGHIDWGDTARAAVKGEVIVEESSYEDPRTVRRVKSAGNSNTAGDSGVTATVTVAATAGACRAAEEQSRSPRQFVRSEVVGRALSTWEGADLEVVCMYDSNFQSANRQGQHGVPMRVSSRTTIGPISYLYRWYCKRATKFRSPMTPEDLPDAPMLSPGESYRSVPAGSLNRGGGGGARSGSAKRNSRPNSGMAGGGAAAAADPPAWLRQATTRRNHSGPSIVSGEGPGVATGGCGEGSRGGVAAAVTSPADHERLTTATARSGSGRRLNPCLDPLISLSELVDLLEDMEIVPQLATRVDVTRIFNAAHQAFTSATGPAGSETITSTAVISSTPANSTAWGAPGGNAPRAAAESHHSNSKPPPAQGSAADSSTTGRHPASAAKPRPASAVTTASGKPLDAWSSISSGFSINSIMKTAAAAAAADSGGPRNAAGRPSSAPRVLSKPTAAAPAAPAAAAATGGVVGSGGSCNIIPRTQPHPEEVRFPAFKDILVRLAVAIACTEPPVAAGAGVTSAAGVNSAVAAPAPALMPAASSAYFSQELTFPNPVLTAAASAVGCSSRGWGRTMSTEDAVAAVRRLLERMKLYRNDIQVLKHRLDELARLANEHAVRARDNRFRYVAVRSVVEAAQDIGVSPGAAQLPPGARPGMSSRPLPPWSVLAASPAPSYLTAILTEEDQPDFPYQPAWREFGAVALDLGVLQPGELRRCRLLLYCRGPYTLSVRIDASDAPFCDVTHMGLQSVPPGLPFRVDVDVKVYDIGEVVGELRLLYTSAQDRRERKLVVPVYGMVCPVGAAAANDVRTWARCASERSVIAAKIAREHPAKASTSVVSTVVVPPRRGPSSPPSLSASLSYLGGYGNSSTSVLACKPCTNTRLGESPSAAAVAPPSPAASQTGARRHVSSSGGDGIGPGGGVASSTGGGSGGDKPPSRADSGRSSSGTGGSANGSGSGGGQGEAGGATAAGGGCEAEVAETGGIVTGPPLSPRGSSTRGSSRECYEGGLSAAVSACAVNPASDSGLRAVGVAVPAVGGFGGAKAEEEASGRDEAESAHVEVEDAGGEDGEGEGEEEGEGEGEGLLPAAPSRQDSGVLDQDHGITQDQHAAGEITSGTERGVETAEKCSKESRGSSFFITDAE